jgi:hypothetical protein
MYLEFDSVGREKGEIRICELVVLADFRCRGGLASAAVALVFGGLEIGRANRRHGEIEDK